MNSLKAREIISEEISYLTSNNGNNEIIQCLSRLLEDSLKLEEWNSYARSMGVIIND